MEMSDLCYICGKHPRQSQTLRGTEPAILRVTCARCGTYDIAHKFIAGERDRYTFLTDDERLRLSHAVRKATDAHGRFGEAAVLGYDSVKQIAAQHPLPDPIEQADLLIEGIAQRAGYGEKTRNESGEVWAARIGMREAALVHAMQNELSSLITSSILQSGDVLFSLTFEGWKRAREIRRERGPGNQAFVAMWFHPGLLAAYTKGFAPALIDTGHQPYRVDFAAHNNKIDDELVAEIRRSKLVIVDTTGARPNAYWEAGFAAGLGIPVIWCCNDSWQAWSFTNEPESATAPVPTSGKWTDNLPFDIRQHAFTFWSDPVDLRKKLTERIRALGFDAAWNRGQ